MGYFGDSKRIFLPDRIRLVFLGLGASAFVITELFRIRLRPLLRDLEVKDFGFTDTVGNSGGILVQIFLSLAIINPNRKQSFRLAAFFTVGYILYEFAQPFLPKGTFDWYDVIATVVGYGLSVPILLVVWNRYDESGLSFENRKESKGD